MLERRKEVVHITYLLPFVSKSDGDSIDLYLFQYTIKKILHKTTNELLEREQVENYVD